MDEKGYFNKVKIRIQANVCFDDMNQRLKLINVRETVCASWQSVVKVLLSTVFDKCSFSECWEEP